MRLEKIQLVGLALFIHSSLFFAFPLYQYFSQKKLEGERKDLSQSKVKTMVLKSEKKQVKKIKLKNRPPKRKQLQRLNEGRFTVKFGLPTGTGATLIDADSEAMIYSEQALDKEPVPLYRQIPEKPYEAQVAGVGGRVEIRVLVDESGRVIQAEVIQGVEGYGLNEAALAAARRWSFEPATVKGLPVRYRVSIPFNFLQ